MDNLLLPLLNAQNEQERQQCLDKLLTIHAVPIVRQVLRQHNFFVSAEGVSESNPDAEDLYQEAMTRLIEVLHENQHSLASIENFGGYVRKVVSNLCADFFRSKSPERARLKDRVRDVFRRHKNLMSWQYENEILCGFAAWRNTGKRVIADDMESSLEDFLPARFANEDVKIVPLSRTVVELLDWIGGPVEIDALVRMLVYVLDIKEQQSESSDDERVAAKFDIHSLGGQRSTELHVETNELLGRLWSVVKGLPAKQRDAFAFRFDDQTGNNLFALLLAAEIVNWNDLARGMGRPIAEISRLRTLMPMDTATAAHELNTSRQNVSKWLHHAMRKLRRKLK
jgi:RNA polymerase sigma factor (sigma-70 family)